MSITLNSILRLQVVKGGNIDFVVNTLNEFTDGIANSDGLDTRFTVASSVDFDVNLYAADATFLGTDIISATPNFMSLLNVGFRMSYTGTGGSAGPLVTDNWEIITALTELKTAPSLIVDSTDGLGAGDKVKNDFTVNWELATAALIAVTAGGPGSLLSQNLNADRYSTNVFLVLTAK